MVSDFIPLRRDFVLKGPMLDRFSALSYLKETDFHKRTVFALVEVLSGGGTMFCNGVPNEVTGRCLWWGSPHDVYTLRGAEEWHLRVLVVDSRIIENIYVNLPGDAALELWRQLAHARTVWTMVYPEYSELHALCERLIQMNDTGEDDFEAVSLLWKATSVMQKMVALSGKTVTARLVQPSRRLLDTMQYMQENYATKLSLDDLAKTANMSVSNFSAVFRKTFGMPPMEYLLRLRLQHAIYQLHHSDEKIITIAEECGFFSNSNFIKSFTRMTGVTPSEYRKQCLSGKKPRTDTPHPQAPDNGIF